MHVLLYGMLNMSYLGKMSFPHPLPAIKKFDLARCLLVHLK